MKLKTFVLASIAAFVSSQAVAERQELTYPNAVHRIFVDMPRSDSETALAASIGFDLDAQYTYTQFAAIKRAHEVGTAGHYDFLLLSTGGSSWDYEAEKRFNAQRCGWEMTYYDNHDITLICEVCHPPNHSRSLVRLLKVGKGRRPNLHLE